MEYTKGDTKERERAKEKKKKKRKQTDKVIEEWKENKK